MKIKLKPFLVYLIKENFIYIILSLSLLFLFFYLNIVFINKINENNNKIKNTKQEIQVLENKITYVNKSLNIDKINQYIKILNYLIPQKEDIFSIIFSLENLSQKTGFVIKNYTINLASTNQSKINIIINGTGSKENFFNFLKDYHLKSGRLINSEEINFSETSLNNNISLYFYNSAKTETLSPLTYTYQTTEDKLKKINEILDKIDLAIYDNIEKESLSDYPKKTNPF